MDIEQRSMEKDRMTRIAAIIVGIILAIVLIFFGFRIVQQRFGSAAGTPTDIVGSGITTNSFDVTFSVSDQCDNNKVVYGLDCTPTGTNLFSQCTATNTTTSNISDCTCPMTLLSPNTTYHWYLTSGTNTYKNASVCYTTTTKSEAESSAPSLSPTQTQTQAPTAVPTASGGTSTAQLTPADQVTDCKFIEDHLGETSGYITYTTLDVMRCRNRLTPTPTP